MERIFVKLVVVSGAVLLSMAVAENSRADWQSELESRGFDIVETFDNLQDWKGSGFGDVTNQGDMPKLGDGSPGMWNYYSNWNNVVDGGFWIASRSNSDDMWGGDGKNLILDYQGHSKNNGPSRLATYIGENPYDGYDDVYFFYMTKQPLSFFPYDANGFKYVGYYKTFDIVSGFRGVWDWGTAEQQQIACNDPQRRNVYGLNPCTINFQGVGGRLSPRYINGIASYNSTNNCSTYAYGLDSTSGHAGGLNLNPVLQSSDWFGLEYHFKMSSYPGANDGVYEVWGYDKNGNVIGYHIIQNFVNFQNTVQLDLTGQKYNKFFFGGNRFTPDFEDGRLLIADSATDSLTTFIHGLETGDVVEFFVDGANVLPAPLVENVKYYAIKISDTSYRIAVTPENVDAGIHLDLTDNGVGNFYSESSDEVFVDDFIIDNQRIGPAYFSAFEEFNSSLPILSSPSSIGNVRNENPTFSFDSSKEGTIAYGGSCSSSTTTATVGKNTITLNALNVGTYSNCTLAVTDSSSNASTPLAIPSFSITYSADLDLDRDVDIFDYNTLLANFGQSYQSDCDGDSDIDIFDYNILIGEFGNSF